MAFGNRRPCHRPAPAFVACPRSSPKTAPITLSFRHAARGTRPSPASSTGCAGKSPTCRLSPDPAQ
jgi:hypothetical protein